MYKRSVVLAACFISLSLQSICVENLPEIHAVSEQNTIRSVGSATANDFLARLVVSALVKLPIFTSWFEPSISPKEAVYAYDKEFIKAGVLQNTLGWPRYQTAEYQEFAECVAEARADFRLARALLDACPDYKKAVVAAYPKSVDAVYNVTNRWKNNAHKESLRPLWDPPNRKQPEFYSVKQRVDSIAIQEHKQHACSVPESTLTFEVIQHELTRAAGIKVPVANSFGCDLLDTSVDFLDTALQVHACGDCATAQKLTGCAAAALDYLVAVVEGAVVGVQHSIEGVCQTVMHPVATARALGDLACKIAAAIPDYVVMAPDKDASLAEFQQYVHELEIVKNNWRAAHAQAYTWWEKTPAREKIKQGAQFATEWVLVDRCFGLLHNAGKAAVAEVKAGKCLSKAAQAELVHAAPGFILVRECEATASLMQTGAQYGFSIEQVEHALTVLETQVGGCRHKFKEMITKLEHVEGIEKNIEKMFKREHVANVRGAWYELDATIKVLENGENIIGTSVELNFPQIGKQEIDIITATSFIECKNWQWDLYLDDINRLNKKIGDLRSALRQKVIAAKSHQKRLVLYSKYFLPPTKEFDAFRVWLKNNCIDLIEG